MKKFLIGLGLLIVILIVVGLAAPFFIPTQVYKDRLIAQVKSATGRDLSIGGNVRLSFLPRVALEAEDVAFANAPGASEKEMATLKTLSVQLNPLPLLRGEVVVDRFVLAQPVIHLEVDKKGQPNWKFGNAQKEAAPQPQSQGPGMASKLEDVHLGEVKIEDGHLTYLDQRSGKRYEASDVDVAVKLPSLDQPVSVDGALVWNQKRVQLTAKADRARAFLDNSETPISAKIASEPVTFTVNGTAKLPAFNGDIELTAPSVRALADWAGQPLPPGGGLGPLSITGKLTADNGKYAFADAKLSLDQIKGTGEAQVDTTGARPRLVAKLAVDGLDLNPYLPAEKRQAAPAPTAGGAASSGWSDDPIDVSALNAADADLELSATDIRYQKIKVDKGLINIKLEDGRLDAELADLELYKGKGTGKLTVASANNRPQIGASFNLDGIQAEPLLTDAADFKRLAGAGALQFDITGAGKSQREIVGSLGGKGALSFTNGAIKGINLAAMVRNVFDPGSASQQTDFSELAGTFTIAQGILSNNDLALKSPLLRLEGAGKVDLPRRSVDYRVTPKAVASLEGQGGKANVAGIMVPVIVKGPWDNLSYQPDLGAAITQQMGDPGKLLERLPGQGSTGSDKPALPKPGDVLKQFLR
jgi:AsmA protein